MTNTIEGQGTKINIDLEYGGRLQTMVEGCRTIVTESSHKVVTEQNMMEGHGRSWNNSHKAVTKKVSKDKNRIGRYQ